MQVVPLPFGFGAQVLGLDVTESVDAATIARLVEAFRRYHLLLWRDCTALDPERQVEICSWFGELHAIDGSGKPRGEGRGWNVLDNAHPSGRDILPFHSDISFMPVPYEGLSLYPTALPNEPTTTCFASNAVAWQALPNNLRARIEGRRARHHYDSATEMTPDWPPLEQWRPVCTPHRFTGELLLYVTQFHVDAIEGMGQAESQATLDELFAVLYAPERVYEHRWRLGDLIVWDNVAVQHSRRRHASPDEGPRVMQRVSFGPRGFTEQLAEARRAAQAT
jgi:taurine dioxygenase